MKAPMLKLPAMPGLIPQLFSAGTLRRAGLREQPAQSGRKGMDSWLLFGLIRKGGRDLRHDK